MSYITVKAGSSVKTYASASTTDINCYLDDPGSGSIETDVYINFTVDTDIYYNTVGSIRYVVGTRPHGSGH